MKALCVIVVLVVAAGLSISAAPLYGVTDLGTLGGTQTYASGINNSGQVVGTSELPDSSSHAFLYSDGRMTDLGTLGGFGSFAVDINDRGQVAGGISYPIVNNVFVYSDGNMTNLGFGAAGGIYVGGINDNGQIIGSNQLDDGRRAFLYTGGSLMYLPTLGGDWSRAWGINNSGEVTGDSDMPDRSAYHAFLWSGGVLTDLGTLGGLSSSGAAINDRGQVVGSSSTTIGPGSQYFSHAFLYTGGFMEDLGTLGGRASWATAINNTGQVIGTSYLPLGGRHGFVYKDGAMRDLNQLVDPNLGTVLVDAVDINDSGQIIASGENGRAYLLTPLAPQPVPEPLTVSLLGAGLLGLVLGRPIGKGCGIKAAIDLKVLCRRSGGIDVGVRVKRQPSGTAERHSPDRQ